MKIIFIFLGIAMICTFMTESSQLKVKKTVTRITILSRKLKDREQLKKSLVVKS